MESHLAANTQDSLIQGLSYSLPNAAEYILARTNVTYFPQGGNSYAPTGVRLIRFQLADNTQFLDPHSIRLMFTLTNNAAAGGAALQLKGPPMVLFQRARILCNGVVVEDIMYANRMYMMLYAMNPQRRNASNLLEWSWQSENPPIAGNTAAQEEVYSTIAATASKRFMGELPFGLFKQPLYLMLKACPITIELEICQDPEEALCTTIAAAGAAAPLPAYEALARSTAFTLSDVQIKADTCTVSQDLVERYSQHLLSGKPLPIPFSSFITQMQALTGQASFNVQVARAFSRLKGVWFNFYRTPVAEAGNIMSGPAISSLGVSNYFYYPPPGGSAITPVALTTANDTLQWQLLIGSKTWPTYPVRGVAETAYRLRCNLDEAQHGDLDIKLSDYVSTKFIAALDVEKAAVGPGAGASFTGVSTRGGEQLLLDIKNWNGLVPHRIYVTCHYDAILNLRAEGVEMLD